MADERAIRAAELAKLEAVVAEHGTEAEQATLLMSGISRSGITLVRLAEAAASGESIGRLTPDPEVLANLTRRAERRAKLRLPRAECAADPPPPYCDCLERALDQLGNEGKRAVLKLAGAFHKRTQREPIRPPAAPDPEESPVSPEEPTDGVEDLFPKPEPRPKAERVRVVKHFPRWYDEAEGRVPFSDMKF
jgi:hypothetical protein